MPPRLILEATRRRPFTPFRLHTTDGSVYEIRHPEMVMLGQQTAVIGMPYDPQEPFERLITIALLHITQLESLEAPTQTAG